MNEAENRFKAIVMICEAYHTSFDSGLLCKDQPKITFTMQQDTVKARYIRLYTIQIFRQNINPYTT